MINLFYDLPRDIQLVIRDFNYRQAKAEMLVEMIKVQYNERGEKIHYCTRERFKEFWRLYSRRQYLVESEINVRHYSCFKWGYKLKEQVMYYMNAAEPNIYDCEMNLFTRNPNIIDT